MDLMQHSGRSSVSAWSVEELANGDFVQATRLPAEDCTEAEATAWHEHAEVRAREVLERHLTRRRQNLAVEPVGVAGCLISGWLLKMGTKFKFRWHERLFTVDAVRSSLLYYARDKALGDLALRGEATLLDIVEHSPRPLVAFVVKQLTLLGAKALPPSSDEAGGTCIDQPTSLIVRIEDPQERELWLNVGRALRSGHAAAIQVSHAPTSRTHDSQHS